MRVPGKVPKKIPVSLPEELNQLVMTSAPFGGTKLNSPLANLPFNCTLASLMMVAGFNRPRG